MPVKPYLFFDGRCAGPFLSEARVVGGKIDRFEIAWMASGARPAP